MTRFARAKGSKASNAKVEEEATSWQVMKNQINTDISECSEQTELSSDKNDEISQVNKKTKWAKFDVINTRKPVKNKEESDEPKLIVSETKKKKKLKNKETKGLDEDEVIFRGHLLRKSDVPQLVKLEKDLKKQNKSKVEIHLARRKVARHLELQYRKEKKKLCFNCREGGHFANKCPKLEGSGTACFKCFSTEHSFKDCKIKNSSNEFAFAVCFVCKEQGHISRQCPDNPRGIYPNGGSCKSCGSVTHLKKNCPKVQEEKEVITVNTIEPLSIPDALEELSQAKKDPNKLKKKIVKF